MFWCRYLCPLGAISNSLKFWIWIGVLFGVYFVADVLGANIPWAVLLGAFCIVGYLLEIFHAKPKFQLLHVTKNDALCNNCGLCMKNCPYHIDIKSCHNGKVNHVDCNLCGECVASCSTGALNIGMCKPSSSKVWKVVPAVLTVVLIALGMWAGGKFELPTIDITWGIENVAEDGTVTTLVDKDALQTTTIEGLRSVKCYGSSMAFKAKLEKVAGVHGVKTFVRRHSADVLFDPAKTTPEKIQEAIYVPSKFRVNTPDHKAVDSLKVVTIRTEGMYDKMDINYLGLQMRNTGKKIYGLESEFDCPLIVRVYMDPSEELDKKWYKEIVEMEVLQMPVHGGGTKEIEVDYKFAGLEDEVSYISTEDFLRSMFSPFKAQWKKRIEEAGENQQYIYEIVNPNYEKPIILRNMPFLSNHLSRFDGVIGVYLTLNKDLNPAIQIRFAEPMTAEKIWELITMETWTITYKKDDVREEGAKISFKEQGVVYPIYE
jgi:ferredoxin/copper chaperone CopZ